MLQRFCYWDIGVSKENNQQGALEKALKEIADFSKDTRTYRLKEQYRRTNTAGSQPSKKVKSN